MKFLVLYQKTAKKDEVKSAHKGSTFYGLDTGLWLTTQAGTRSRIDVLF